jgi:hypothetical protein
MDSPINTEARELKFHRGNENMLIYHSNKTAGFPYEHFPYFGKRIEKLRHYMDFRKPKTLLDLARLKEPSGFILISTVARYDGYNWSNQISRLYVAVLRLSGVVKS